MSVSPIVGVTTKRSTLFQRLNCWVRSVLFYENWVIGLIDQPITHAPTWTQTPPIRWITSFDKKRYLADPFPWPGSADTFLAESYATDTRIGSLVALKLGDGGITDEVPLNLPLPGHLSFPFLFQHDGQTFMMPESCAARRLEIFCWQPENNKWIPYTTIFTDKPVADAVLFLKDAYFWVFYTDVTHDPHDNLHLIYAPSLRGPWLAHPHNPVQRGRSQCRGAGNVFKAGGKLYRPAQDCSRVYGGALRLMEIVTCTPTSYEEIEVAHLVPTARDVPDGIHTLNAWGDRCLVDGMRLTFSWTLVIYKVRKRLGF
jgi:hypothetical protein